MEHIGRAAIAVRLHAGRRIDHGDVMKLGRGCAAAVAVFLGSGGVFSEEGPRGGGFAGARW